MADLGHAPTLVDDVFNIILADGIDYAAGVGVSFGATCPAELPSILVAS